jgi:hypothetical protein
MMLALSKTVLALHKKQFGRRPEGLGRELLLGLLR